MKLSETDAAIEWLSKFKHPWRDDAVDLIDALTLVSHDLFLVRLRGLVLERAEATKGVIGLYAERELPKRGGVPHRLFKQSVRRPRRAFGWVRSLSRPRARLTPKSGARA